MRGIRLSDMNMSQLETVWQTLRAVEASITNADRALGASRYATISDMAEALREDLSGLRTKQNRSGPIGGLEKFLSVEMLRPVDYMHRSAGRETRCGASCGRRRTTISAASGRRRRT